MKILYAIGNKPSGGIQLNRFLLAIRDQNHLVKVAAFKKTRQVIYRDWTLDALLDIIKPDTLSLDNDNLGIYYDQVKAFNPDLVISDLEPFTSYLATLLAKPVIQVGSKVAFDGLANKDPLRIKAKYKEPLFRINRQYDLLLKNVLDNAEMRLAYSPLCDLKDPPKLKESFAWVRPYHVLGNLSIPAQHQIVGIGASVNRRDMIRLLKRYQDAVLFTDHLDESFAGLTMKDTMRISEYAVNLRNAEVVVNLCQQDHIADAFYNGKFCLMMPDFSDSETLINALLAEHYKLGQTIYDANDRIQTFKPEIPEYDPNVQFLHEKIGGF